MLSNSSHFVVNNSNCQFIERSTAESSGLKILHKASLPNAAYDSVAREIALHFIPKTDREDFVAEFVTWTRRADFPVMRLTGPKSNLAQLCAEKVREELAATFCFSESTTTEDPRRVFTTLADQIATYIPAYAEILDIKLRRNPGLVSKSLKLQFEELIAAPIKELLARGIDLGPRRVIVVEGIDECAGVHARCEILCTILESASGLPFRWAIFSRPDSQLEELWRERSLAAVSCWKNGNVSTTMLRTLLEKHEAGDKGLDEKWAKFSTHGLALLYLGTQEGTSATIELLRLITEFRRLPKSSSGLVCMRVLEIC
ncbi:hypothetical protein P691DRAFT_763000 [Macrolepiota fuliginosa MF-IS2]|uniref:Nephrocystin 3-like N-terminal domain-containing protein n=1 Tax=Macrolepiota fuliginosa MF-IS2 TaxID=1400762 RepID=A0A9P5X7P1_9AGAR|nr:hypothetical protein P691DRAFT_763000 [Macrolepiota fuliginosa MF-IS2]